MKAILTLFLCIFVSAIQATPARIVSNLETAIIKDDQNLTGLKSIIDTGMDKALQTAIDELTARGYTDLANQISSDWDARFQNTLFGDSHDIGDHAGISQWVNDTYRKIELLLGRDFCVQTHIAAMLTFNSANVVVKPCTFPMDAVTGTRIDEYRRHFAGKSSVSDSKYDGVVPEATYFACEIACIAATSGAGSLVCGLAAGLGEKLMATFVAPKLSDRVFNRFCAPANAPTSEWE